MAQIEVQEFSFPREITLTYEEFDVSQFFDEVLAYTRTPHRLYRVEEDSLEILIGVTHPITFQITADKKDLDALVTKLRLFGFLRGDWKWK